MKYSAAVFPFWFKSLVFTEMCIKHMVFVLYLSFATLTKVVSHFLQDKLSKNVPRLFVSTAGYVSDLMKRGTLIKFVRGT